MARQKGSTNLTPRELEMKAKEFLLKAELKAKEKKSSAKLAAMDAQIKELKKKKST